MGDMKAVFDSLYTNLLLRDLGGKVAPGMVVLAAAHVAMMNQTSTLTLINSANLGLWLVAVAIGWLTGIAIQGLGEAIARLGDFAGGKNKWLRWLSFLPSRLTPPGKSEAEWFDLLDRFDRAADSTEHHRFERLVVTREASGNGAVALVLAIGILASAKTITWTVGVTGFVTVVGLALFHSASVRRNWSYMEKIVAKTPNTPPQLTSGA